MAKSFHVALRELRTAAGEPTYATMATWLRRQERPMEVSTKTLSDWFTGKVTVARNVEAQDLLIGLLQREAQRRNPGYEPRPRQWWRELRTDSAVEHDEQRPAVGRVIGELTDADARVSGVHRSSDIDEASASDLGKHVAEPLSRMWSDGTGLDHADINVMFGSAGIDPAAFTGAKARRIADALKSHRTTSRRGWSTNSSNAFATMASSTSRPTSPLSDSGTYGKPSTGQGCPWTNSVARRGQTRRDNHPPDHRRSPAFPVAIRPTVQTVDITPREPTQALRTQVLHNTQAKHPPAQILLDR